MTGRRRETDASMAAFYDLRGLESRWEESPPPTPAEAPAPAPSEAMDPLEGAEGESRDSLERFYALERLERGWEGGDGPEQQERRVALETLAGLRAELADALLARDPALAGVTNARELGESAAARRDLRARLRKGQSGLPTASARRLRAAIATLSLLDNAEELVRRILPGTAGALAAGDERVAIQAELRKQLDRAEDLLESLLLSGGPRA